MTERPGPSVDDATRRRAVVAATTGNFVEWYDFTIYGYFATVIAALFFTSEDPLTSILATFAIFGVAFLVRPVGALVIGSIGDRIGRRATLSGVILLMSGATFLIGIAPPRLRSASSHRSFWRSPEHCRGSRPAESSAGRPRSWSSTPQKNGAPSMVAGKRSPKV
jgi:hypothetical protein